MCMMHMILCIPAMPRVGVRSYKRREDTTGSSVQGEKDINGWALSIQARERRETQDSVFVHEKIENGFPFISNSSETKATVLLSQVFLRNLFHL